jgi:NAD(P)-dependent dehydrogenase (short-subunit alcohol dehydrogenase family)
MSTTESGPVAVVVTGASTGIGESCALELDRRGYRVFAGVRSEAAGRRLQSQASPRLVPLRLDVTDAVAIAEAARTVGQRQGRAGLAGLVNNAGIVVAGPLEILPLDELRRQLEVNLVGQVAVTQAFLPLLRAARGRIVNMSSANGRISSPYLGPYAASKHGLEAISDALRTELRAWGIHVAVVEPGSIATPIWDKSLAAAEQLEGTASPEALALYQTDLNAMRTAAKRLAAEAIPVAHVVRAVVHALTAPRPKTRYPVGLQTRIALRLFKWIPDRLWDRMLRKQLGLPEKGSGAGVQGSGVDRG